MAPLSTCTLSFAQRAQRPLRQTAFQTAGAVPPNQTVWQTAIAKTKKEESSSKPQTEKQDKYVCVCI